MLRNVDWYLDTDVSENPIGPILKGQAAICFPEKSVTNYQSALRNIPEE
jgi:hypothetical protein